MSSPSVEKVIADLRDGGEGKLRCPRCGWRQGGIWHCGLCEGDEANIEAYYRRLIGDNQQ